MTVALAADFWRELGITQWTARHGFQPQAAEELTNPKSKPKLKTEARAVQWVLIGDDLAKIWQNEQHQAWLLWRNMINVHLQQPQQMLFFDTSDIHSEQAAFDVIEQLIELGVETVFSMSPEHMLHSMLAESIQLETLPSFEQMLDQPILKRQAFIKLSHVFYP